MRVLLITDIHANREALEACLAHARLMKAELQRMVDTAGLSKDVFEQASKSLA